MSTAAERVAKFIHDEFCSAPLNGWDDVTMAADLVAIAQPRILMALKDFSQRTGREKTTLQSWIKRGQHDMPLALGTTSAGQIWNGEDVEKWCDEHPELLLR